MATESPKGPSLPPRADELVDPVRMTRSVSLSDCHLHLDLPHPRRVQIWGEGKGGEVTPRGWWQPPRTRYTMMARCACAWGRKKANMRPWGFGYMPS